MQSLVLISGHPNFDFTKTWIKDVCPSVGYVLIIMDICRGSRTDIINEAKLENYNQTGDSIKLNAIELCIEKNVSICNLFPE